MKFLPIIFLAFRHGKKLVKPCRASIKVEDLTAENIKGLGAEAVILDHDGVLGPNFSDMPDETGARVIRDMARLFSGKVFILSNSIRKKAAREKAYAERFPEVIFIKAKRKPDPDGLYIASKLCGVPADRIAVIDDGMLTGILMAAASGAIPLYAKRRELKESLFAKAVRLMTTLPQIVIANICVSIRRIF